jgi:3-hydroxybutyryl-CoA dehydrogenase
MNKISKIGIIGEGKMGTNLFYYLLDFPFSLVWVCSADADIEKIIHGFAKKIKRLFNAGILSEAKYTLLQNDVLITADIHEIRSCDLVMETIYEDLELKKRLFKSINSIANPQCIITSNSSSFNPSELLPERSRKDYFAGLHFFYPVSLKNIVEIIVTDSTSQATIDLLVEFLSIIDRNYLLLKENSSFILNRIFLGFQNEAYRIVTEMKLSIAQMDELVKNEFFPSGVFEFCDHVGNEIMLTSVRNYTANVSDKQDYQTFIDKLEELVQENRLGVKSSSGFYSYPREESPKENSIQVIEPEIYRKIIFRLQSSMKQSIEKFSLQSGIFPAALNNAMKEYLGMERDLY